MKYSAVEKKNEENLYELIWNDLRTLLRKNTEQHLWYVTFLCKKEEKKKKYRSICSNKKYIHIFKNIYIKYIHICKKKETSKECTRNERDQILTDWWVGNMEYGNDMEKMGGNASLNIVFHTVLSFGNMSMSYICMHPPTHIIRMTGDMKMKHKQNK